MLLFLQEIHLISSKEYIVSHTEKKLSFEKQLNVSNNQFNFILTCSGEW